MSKLDDIRTVAWEVDAYANSVDDVRYLLGVVDKLRAALLAAKVTHTTCEDGWYSCPMSEEGCLDERETECTCGAEKHNAAIDSALDAEVKSMPQRGPK
jgi:hypothetical protein